MSNQQTGSGSPVFSWLSERSAGVLLHPTTFPSDQGIGVLDESIDRLFEFLSAAGIRQWQFCPLGPTGYGDSPYQCFSAFAGNPYLIDLKALVNAGLLADFDLAGLRELPQSHVDFGWLYVTKWPVLFRAYQNFKARGDTNGLYGDFSAFRVTHGAWLEPYTLFLALKDHYKGQPWWEWPTDVRFFKQAQNSPLAAVVADRAEAHAFFQYLFFGQWQQVRAKARALNIELVGDAPIFVARDSADAWTHPELFQLDAAGHPLFVAGVPPDYFSADGQLWGNPLYDWPVHQKDGYSWWIDRLRSNFELCDIVRIDHFRAFDTYWSVPASAKTAKTGEWRQGPGLEFFQAVKAALPDARLIAEDLGELLPSVVELRAATGLPGMTILQFAFGGDSANLYLPHNLRHNSVVYPGTHDNDTTLGWYRAADEKTHDQVRSYFRISGQEISWDFVRVAYASVSNLAVIPMQDFMSLGAEARFNTPGVASGNWQWRYMPFQLDRLLHDSAPYLGKLARLYGRA